MLLHFLDTRSHKIMESKLTWLVILIKMTSMAQVTSPTSRTDFTAAVYEHEVIVPQHTLVPVSRHTALQNMEKNLAAFRLRASEARIQGADILVLPEDSLYGYNFTRETILPYLEYIPEPAETDLAPCDNLTPDPGSEVQQAFSCIAKDNALYLVADMGDKQPCYSDLQKTCPADGHFQYNTAVAYGPSGKLLAKYHKTHLYKEAQFDSSDPEVKYFHTPFGRVGLLICFDLLFSEPLISMVNKHRIKTIAFPTAWMDSLPILSAIGFHSSVARGLKVNILSANLHLPGNKFQGSGMFGPDGIRSFYYNNTPASSSRLLVSQVGVVGECPDEDTNDPAHCSVEEPKRHGRSDSAQGNNRRHEALKIPKPVKNVQQWNNTEFTSDVQDMPSFDVENFTFVALAENASDAHACRNQLCCNVKYARLGDKSASELFVLGVFDGVFHSKYYFQVCTVLKCPSTDPSTCGSTTFESRSQFTALILGGNFRTGYIYPQIVFSRSLQLELAQANQWSFKKNTLAIGENVTAPILSATLIGRIYSLDPKQ